MNELPPGLPLAAPWSLFAGQFGKGSIVAAIVFFLLAFLISALGDRAKRIEKAGTAAFVLGSFSLFAAFGTLTLLFLRDQFQYRYVYEHAETATALSYKIAGVWTAQEGSFLLWACTSAFCALIALAGTGPYRRGFVATSSLFLATLGGILASNTPFDVIKEVVAHGKTFMPPDGSGMTPALQNYWVVIHPPIIFLGFGSLSLIGAYALAAMLRGDAEDWVARVRPWALASVAILGLGIALGGLWAYETQGWGGFWAWDPVENVSFVPWLFLVAFAHGLIVQNARGKWGTTNLFLGILPFIAFVYGTYLTRSGLLDKVSNHSFATMDAGARGLLKDFLIASVVGSLAIFWFRGRPAGRAASANAQPDQTGYNREGAYRYGMLLLSLLAVVITLGMSWPVVSALRSGEGSRVEEGLYHLVVVWFFLPLMALMGITPFLSWRAMEAKALRDRLFGVACIAIGVTGLLHLVLISTPFGVHPIPGETVATPFGFHLPLTLWMLVLLFSVMFVLVANLWRVGEIVRRSTMGVGGFVAHVGLAVLMGGLILSRGYERKQDRIDVREGSPASGLGYTIAFKGATSENLRDRDRKIEFEVTQPDGSKFIARPGHYLYGNPNEPSDQVWPHIEHFASHDVYVSMAAPVVMATQDPIALKPGSSQDLGGAIVEYVKPTQNGKFGLGAKFGAVVRLTETDSQNISHQYLAKPEIEVTKEGLRPSIAQLGPNLCVAMAGGVDPNTRSAQFMLMFNPPVYRITLYEKPLTGLVWLGTGILTLGGAMSAVSRRRVTARRSKKAPSLSDAPVPAPQG